MVNRIGHRDAIIFIPARDRIKEGLFIGIFEFQVPRYTAVGGFVYPRAFAVTDAQDIRRVSVKGLDVTEIELLRTGHDHHLPRFASVDSADNRPARAACPDDFLIDDRQSAKTCGRVDGLFDPLSRNRKKKGARDQARKDRDL